MPGGSHVTREQVNLSLSEWQNKEMKGMCNSGCSSLEDADCNESYCECHDDEHVTSPSTSVSTSDVIQTVLVTICVSVYFYIAKSAYDEIRHIMSRVTLVVIGAGPIGLLSLFVAAKCRRVSQMILFEEKSRFELLNNNYQIALDSKSVSFLRTLGIDFDNIEGCWDEGSFFTRIGVLLEYLLSSLPRTDIPVDVRLKTKFTRDSLKELETIFGRLVAVVCDGATGRASSLLGLSDEFTPSSCRSYGAVAILERPDQRSVPAPEIRVHNLNFHVDECNNDFYKDSTAQGFHLKIYGSLRHRCMTLAVPRGESKTVKMLKVVLDQSVMRNIFMVCYNTYKSEPESDIPDTNAVKWLKFSPRLFEVKLMQRLESVAFVEDANIFVITEGDTARRLNIHTGLDVNLGISGLTSLEKFLQMAASADCERTIIQALSYKHNHSKILEQEFSKNGLKNTMYT